jgi:hypothetical protein
MLDYQELQKIRKKYLGKYTGVKKICSIFPFLGKKKAYHNARKQHIQVSIQVLFLRFGFRGTSAIFFAVIFFLHNARQ